MSNIVYAKDIILTQTTFKGNTTIQTVDCSNRKWRNNTMERAFSRCSNLTGVTNLNNNVTNMNYAFEYCNNLTTPPVLPENTTSLEYTFRYCKKLVEAPAIPESTTNMAYTFYKCETLTTAPVIPENVTNLVSTFRDCTALTGDIFIYAKNINGVTDCFVGTSAPKNVYVYLDSTTYTKLTNAGYDDQGTLHGVYLKDITQQVVEPSLYAWSKSVSETSWTRDSEKDIYDEESGYDSHCIHYYGWYISDFGSAVLTTTETPHVGDPVYYNGEPYNVLGTITGVPNSTHIQYDNETWERRTDFDHTVYTLSISKDGWAEGVPSFTVKDQNNNVLITPTYNYNTVDTVTFSDNTVTSIVISGLKSGDPATTGVGCYGYTATNCTVTAEGSYNNTLTLTNFTNNPSITITFGYGPASGGGVDDPVIPTR